MVSGRRVPDGRDAKVEFPRIDHASHRDESLSRSESLAARKPASEFPEAACQGHALTINELD